MIPRFRHTRYRHAGRQCRAFWVEWRGRIVWGTHRVARSR